MPLTVKPRNVSLTLENDAFITERVASGRFANASEVVRAGLRLLVEDERRRDAHLNKGARKRDNTPIVASKG